MKNYFCSPEKTTSDHYFYESYEGGFVKISFKYVSELRKGGSRVENRWSCEGVF